MTAAPPLIACLRHPCTPRCSETAGAAPVDLLVPVCVVLSEHASPRLSAVLYSPQAVEKLAGIIQLVNYSTFSLFEQRKARQCMRTRRS